MTTATATKHVNFYSRYGADIHSQNGEDGVLDEVFKRLKISKGSCCEFGAADGKYCSNTMNLIAQGWKGKMIEADPAWAKALIDNTIKYGVELYFGNITVQNVNELVPQTLNLLSIDVDNDDYHLWHTYKGIAAVVIIEINSSVAPGVEMFPGTKGSSYTSMVKLGIDKGYFLLAHKGNCIFILNKYRKLFPEIEGDGLSNAEMYFDRSWLNS